MCLLHAITFKDCQHVHHWVIEQHEPAIYCSNVRTEHQGESKEALLCPECSRRARESVHCNGSVDLQEREEKTRESEKAGGGA